MNQRSRDESPAFRGNALGTRASGRRASVFDARRRRNAFTLIEVMIALGIFFMAMFAILGLVSNALRNARALQRKTVDCGMVAAELSLTNKLTEALESGDFGDMYPDFEWTRDITEVQTNHLYQVDMIVQRNAGGPVESKMSILLFRPDSLPGSLDGGGLR